MRRHHLGQLAILVVFPLIMLLAASAMPAQVFVVGVKSATDDVITEFHPTRVDLPTGNLDERGRLDLIRNLEAEQGFAHRELPFGPGLTLVANGNMFPHDDDYKKMLYEKGQAAAPGDRMEISALKFERDAIVIDFNGGPYAKHRFLSHISINNNPLAQLGPMATGCRIALVFEGGIPDISAAEVKALLDPVVDFKAKSSLEAYTNTLAPKVREAVESHDILVGMDRRMVMASVGAPLSRHREHSNSEGATTDPNAPVYEEWIYGQPPEPTRFVRFRSGRVVRLEIAAIGKPIEVHDKNELGVDPGPALIARTILNGDTQAGLKNEEKTPVRPPTLARPGEVLDTPRGEGRVNMPTDPPPHFVPSK
jgi:hypothetical protein